MKKKTWSVPSGGREVDETYQACCLREVEEETGYQTEVSQFIKVKTGYYDQPQLAYEVHYFLLNKIAGQMNIQDPDQLIYEIAWKSIGEIRSLKMSFPEDRMFLINFMNQQQRKNWSEKNET